MQINDGTGRGYSAKVSENGRVAVDTDDGALAAARAGTLYSVSTYTSGKPTLTITSTGGVLLYLNNAGGSRKSLVIDSITAGVSATMECRVIVGHIEGTLSDNTALTVSSTNTAYQTGSSANADANVWDETNHGIGGLTGGTSSVSTILGAGSTEVVPAGKYIVAPGGNIAVAFKLAGEATATIRFYEVDDHTYI